MFAILERATESVAFIKIAEKIGLKLQQGQCGNSLNKVSYFQLRPLGVCWSIRSYIIGLGGRL